MKNSEQIISYLQIILIAFVFYKIFIKSNEYTKNKHLTVDNQHEIVNPGNLFNEKRQITEFGWSRYYLKSISMGETYPVLFGFKWLIPFKFKKFNYYSFTFDNKLVQIGIGSIFKVFNLFVNIYDFEEKELNTNVYSKIYLSNPTLENLLIDDPFDCKKNKFNFEDINFNLAVSSEKLNDVCEILINLKINNIELNSTIYQNTKDENVFDITPISPEGNYFFYGTKIYNNVCKAKVNLNDKNVIDKNKDCIGSVDYGRGVFYYRTSWKWASFSGKDSKGDLITLNFGSGATHPNSKSNEDFAKYNKKIIKLNPVDIIYEKENLFNGVKIQSFPFNENKYNYAEIYVEVYHEHVNQTNKYIFSSFAKYAFGKASGFITNDNGEKIEFENLIGIFEQVDFKW